MAGVSEPIDPPQTIEHKLIGSVSPRRVSTSKSPQLDASLHTTDRRRSFIFRKNVVFLGAVFAGSFAFDM